MQITPWLSIDVETTGLNLEKSQILQLAAVWDDGSQSISDLRRFNVIIDNGPLTYGEPYALQLNNALLRKISTDVISTTYHEGATMYIVNARRAFYAWVNNLNAGKAIFIGGKNVAGFDVPILNNNGFHTALFKHRVIDPGSMYLKDFGQPANLTQINELIGNAPVTHDALQDCIDVILAVRHKTKD